MKKRKTKSKPAAVSKVNFENRTEGRPDGPGPGHGGFGHFGHHHHGGWGWVAPFAAGLALGATAYPPYPYPGYAPYPYGGYPYGGYPYSGGGYPYSGYPYPYGGTTVAVPPGTTVTTTVT